MASSVYSRSISGDTHSARGTPQPRRPGALQPDGRSLSSGSSSSTLTGGTVKKSPLGVMRLASDPDVVFTSQSNDFKLQDHHIRAGSVESSTSSNSEINDAATLQRRLPSVKAVSTFGEPLSWTSTEGQEKGSKEQGKAKHYYQRSYELCMGEMQKTDFAPLNARRTRGSLADVGRAI